MDLKLEPQERTLFFTKQVDQSSISELTEKIIRINDSDEKLVKIYDLYDLKYVPQPIKVYIDSYGGMVYQCLGLISIMEKSKTPIHTIVTGCAMSCGFMILICGHKRFAHKLSTPLYHQIGGSVGGKIKDVEDTLEEMKRMQTIWEEITVEKTKISAKKLREIYNSKKDWHMSAQDALELGVVDEIL